MFCVTNQKNNRFVIIHDLNVLNSLKLLNYHSYQYSSKTERCAFLIINTTTRKCQFRKEIKFTRNTQSCVSLLFLLLNTRLWIETCIARNPCGILHSPIVRILHYSDALRVFYTFYRKFGVRSLRPHHSLRSNFNRSLT